MRRGLKKHLCRTTASALSSSRTKPMNSGWICQVLCVNDFDFVVVRISDEEDDIAGLEAECREEFGLHGGEELGDAGLELARGVDLDDGDTAGAERSDEGRVAVGDLARELLSALVPRDADGLDDAVEPDSSIVQRVSDRRLTNRSRTGAERHR